ncbi:TonB-dependent receptor [Flavivirga sp. 57AJ16]|uniref:TonB-dependent receptor n=1 Tax=Flavivirga sp. 57AJ16 TaxID=3025307 RepID=UPI00236694B8|nr:TonB-dependent receptor [Flavivirga sp. 57AJ16]MDD7888148.1 TonB-dependent receptor [Flavivirga sp. 57AJ16]
MKKLFRLERYASLPRKFDLKMKLTTLVFIVSLFQLQANDGHSQKIKISIDFQNVSLEKVLDEVESLTEFKFLYKDKQVNYQREVSIKANNEALSSVLKRLFADSNVIFKVKGEQIILKQGKLDRLPKDDSAVIEKAKQQKLNITGSVKDVNGSPLPGASVLIKGSVRGTVTDFDGNYALTVEVNDVLVISYLGFITKEVVVNDSNIIDVVLNESNQALEEVVIVGYGTQKRSQVVGAVDQVGSESFEGRATVNTTQALQGKSPSLTIQQTNSEPGAGLNVNIRGIGTLGNNSPLVVIDGIVGGDINSLNPADIENVSVLKDAGSAAIYGSRASNGVILISTKKGRKNTPMTVQYSGLVGYNSPRFFTQPVHGYENAILRNQAAYNSNESTAVFTSDQISQFRAEGDNEWFAEEIVTAALQQNQNLSISGGSENSSYLVSLGYLNQGSNFVGPRKGMERYNYRINTTNEYGKLKITSNISYSKQKITDHSSSTATLMVDAFRVPLYYKQVDEEGNYLTNDVLNQFNSLGILEQGGFRKYDNDDIFGNFDAEFQITDALKVRGVFGGRLYSNTLYARRTQVDFLPKGVYGADNNTDDESRKSLDLNTQLMVQYSKTFNEKHDVSALVGVSNENHSDRGTGIFKKYTDIDLGTPITDTEISEDSYNSNQSSSKNSLNSLFGRLSYNLNQKYYAEFNFRYDGSSKFRKEKRWGFFPSLSLGYKVTDEAFMDSYREKFGNIKFRGSYGVLGNQNVGNYQYQTTFFTFQNAYGYNNEGVSGTGYNFANPDIQWEKSATLNLGADLDFLKGALTMSLDYFDTVTSDILVPPAVPGVYGTNLPDFNAGKVGNRGWEVSATYRHYGKLFKHSLNVSISDTKNKVLDFQGEERLTGIEELQLLLREGEAFNSYVGLKRDGIFQNMEEIEGAAVPEGLTVVPGDNRYVDANNDGVINDDDKFIFDNSFPRYTYGVTYNLGFKNFDFSLFVQGVGKRTMMLRGELVEPFHFNYGATMYTHQLDFWSPMNPDAKYPRLANAGSQSNTNNFRRGSDMYLYNGAYLRLKNIQLGYTLPDNITEKLGMKNLHFYVSGQNLLTLSKVDFVDPELSEFNSNLSPNGANSGRAYPSLSYYGLGVDITF